MPRRRSGGDHTPIASKAGAASNAPRQKMTGMSDWNADLLPRTTRENVHKARLRMVEAGLKAGASREDIEEVLSMLGECNDRGLMINVETS